MVRMSINVKEKDKHCLLEIFEQEDVSFREEHDMKNFMKEGDKVIFVIETNNIYSFRCTGDWKDTDRKANSSHYKMVEMEDLRVQYGKYDDSKYIDKTEVDKFQKQLIKKYG